MKKINFSKGWLFGTDERKVDLPHDYMIELPREKSYSPGLGFFAGEVGLYKKEFVISNDDKDKKVYVEFEGVYMNAEIKINENIILRHPYGYTSFICDLTPYIKFGETNVLGVRVDNSTVPNSRWYSGSGIYRNV